MNQAERTTQTGWSYVIVFIVLFVMAFFVLKASTASADPGKYVKVMVQNGDTLWEMANTYKEQSHMNRTQFIKWVETRNHVDSHRLNPGEMLVIPVERN